MRIAVYGGSFDPVTTAHVTVMAAVLQSGQCDEVWVVPCGPRPDKRVLTEASQRLVMCHLAVEGTFGARSPVFVKDDDVRRGSNALSTLELARHLKSRHPHDFFFVVGSDLLPTLPNWQNSAELLDECNFLVHPRPGYDIDPEILTNPRLKAEILRPPDNASTTLARTFLSSTEVRHRARVARGDRNRFDILLDGLVPPLVKSFILRHHIYLDD